MNLVKQQQGAVTGRLRAELLALEEEMAALGLEVGSPRSSALH